MFKKGDKVKYIPGISNHYPLDPNKIYIVRDVVDSYSPCPTTHCTTKISVIDQTYNKNHIYWYSNRFQLVNYKNKLKKLLEDL